MNNENILRLIKKELKKKELPKIIMQEKVDISELGLLFISFKKNNGKRK